MPTSKVRRHLRGGGPRAKPRPTHHATVYGCMRESSRRVGRLQSVRLAPPPGTPPRSRGQRCQREPPASGTGQLPIVLSRPHVVRKGREGRPPVLASPGSIGLGPLAAAICARHHLEWVTRGSPTVRPPSPSTPLTGLLPRGY